MISSERTCLSADKMSCFNQLKGYPPCLESKPIRNQQLHTKEKHLIVWTNI